MGKPSVPCSVETPRWRKLSRGTSEPIQGTYLFWVSMVETVETTNDNGGWKLGVALKCSWPMDTIFGQPRNCRRSVGTVGGGGTHSHNTR